MHLTTSVVFAGLGGQGVLTAAEILAQAAFRAGCDVKKSEVHGMAQRGGLVISDVRFGTKVLSPMTSLGDADCLVLLDSNQLSAMVDRLRKDGVLITPEHEELRRLSGRRSLNIAMLGILSRVLNLAAKHFETAMNEGLKPSLRESSISLFRQYSDVAGSFSQSPAELPQPSPLEQKNEDARVSLEPNP